MTGRVLLGITASAAAYKGVFLASLLRREGLAVDAILTHEACRLVTPLQVSCITGRPALVDLFTDGRVDPAPHITLSDGALLAVVAPATAHCLSRLAGGLADDLLTATLLACDCPLLLAPAMNSRMWSHPATRENVQRLRERGVHFSGPVGGMLACGTVGEGRMQEPELIARACLEILEKV